MNTMNTLNTLVADLRAQLSCSVIAPGDADYDAARSLFYGGIDRRPAAIVRCANAHDVARAIGFARANKLPLAVRSGGHSIAGHSVCEGGVVIDLSAMRRLEIDPATKSAWADAGVRAADLAEAASPHGLAIGFGDAGTVGVGGITIGGGVGFLSRKHGLTIDSLLAAEVVTADGQIRHVDASSDPDLFWAIRGGGGNFGVVTRFHFQLHDVPSVVGGILMLPATADVIVEFARLAAAAPDELSTIANVMTAPPMPFIPAEHHGKLIVMAFMCYAGDTAAGERVIAPFRALATPLADMVKPIPYAQMFPPEQPGYHPIASVRTLFADGIDAPKAARILDAIKSSTAMMSAVQFRVLGGAIAGIANDATAYGFRHQPMMINVAALYTNVADAPTHDAWIGGVLKILEPKDSSAYVNFVGAEGNERVRDAYPAQTWDRLRRIKRAYDPENIFRLNQNIPPA
jgi:FAD/FMN-containing dehydrogenase